MEFPKLTKKLKGMLTSIGGALLTSEKIILSASLLTLSSGSPTAQPRVPADPKEMLQTNQISKYSAKYLIKSAAASFSKLFLQHRSHSSHSSHSSHRSHASHYSSGTTPPPPSHSSHYSSSTPSPIRTAPSSPSITTSPSTERGRSSVVLSDYFNDESFSGEKWRRGSLTAGLSFTDEEVETSEAGGRLQITPRSEVSGRSYNGYVTASTWNLTSAHARVEALQVTASTANTIFAVGTDSDNWYGFVVESDKLYMQSKIDGKKNSVSIPYSFSQHRFWRIRHEATDGEILWETSRDGENWIERRRMAPQIPLTNVYVYLGAGTYLSESNPGVALFDNFRFVVHTQ